jgi:cytochrome c oxidase subunit II
VRRLRRALTSVAVLALALAGAAAAGNGGLAPQAPASPNAGGIRDVYWLILGITGAVFVVVELALFLFVFRYRSRGRAREVEGPQIRGHTNLELAWTVAPAVLLAAIAAFVFYKLPRIQDVPKASAGTENLDVKIEAHQFYWEFVYPNGVISVNRMRVPAGEPVRLTVVSADVAHSWWIPSLGGKLDAIPGRTNHTWFRAARAGTFVGQCAEFCGIQHAVMRATVEALEPSAFRSWYAQASRAQTEGTSDLGKQTFEGVCAVCHGLQGQGFIGRKLDQNPILSDRDALTTVLRRGRRLGFKVMPPVGATWGDRQLDATIAYLQRRFAPKGGGGGG